MRKKTMYLLGIVKDPSRQEEGTLWALTGNLGKSPLNRVECGQNPSAMC